MPSGRTFEELNPTGGGAQGIPTGNTQFNPVSVWGKPLPSQGYGPDPTGPAYNPYGIARPQESYGKSAIYGGPRDLMKSVATRSLATALTDQEMQSALQGGAPQGLTNALQGFANRGGGGLLNEAYQNNIAPDIERSSLMRNLDYRNQLAQLMQNSYIQGGELLGSSKKAWAAAKDVDKRRRAQHTAYLQQVIGSFLPQEAGIRDIGQGATGLTG
jgi:hypothetical protein